MKIGMLTDCYRPVINGVTNCVAMCKREMELAGNQVFVFTFGHLDQPDEETGILRSPGIRVSDTGYYFGLEYSHQARRVLAEMDILHIHHPFTSGQAGTRHGRRLGVPMVFTNHTRYDLYANTYFPRVPPDLVHNVLARYMATFTSECDLVVAPSRGLYEVAIGWGIETEMIVIPNGVDLDRLRNPRRRASRGELGIPDGATLLVYCGRLSPEKNLDQLMSAFQRVSQEVQDVYLLLIGGGPEEGKLREGTAGLNRVRFTGWIEHEDVPGYLALGDLFVTASVTEVHPLVVIEALGAGLPVVAVHSPGISETVRHGIDGYLTGTVEGDFAAAILRMVQKPALRAEMAQNARQRSLLYDIRVTARALLAQYHRLVAA